MTQWIKCSERMPDDDTVKLISSIFGYDVAHYDAHAKCWYDRHYNVTDTDDVSEWMSIPDSDVIHYITE